ncbi:histidine phosphatase family protein, partial [Enterococcus faecalis]|uniref:histidine phosphatase family protein n=1 Tax=Enterococcus faecalis TaxID=1351 RepID=UPI003D6A8806
GIQQELNHPVEIVYTDTLKELGLARLEGQYIEEMRNFYGEELDHLPHRLDLYDPTIFDGEPIEQAIQGISETVAEAAKQH